MSWNFSVKPKQCYMNPESAQYFVDVEGRIPAQPGDRIALIKDGSGDVWLQNPDTATQPTLRDCSPIFGGVKTLAADFSGVETTNVK